MMPSRFEDDDEMFERTWGHKPRHLSESLFNERVRVEEIRVREALSSVSS